VKRPYLATECDNLGEAERWRQQVNGHLPILRKTERSSVLDPNPAYHVNPVPDTGTNPDPDPVPDPGFDDQKCKKIQLKNILHLFFL
jgi:hypothetical protein